MTNMRVKNGLLLTMAAASVFLLSGCFQTQAQPSGSAVPSDTASASSSPSASASSTPASSGSATPSSTGTTPSGVALCKAGSLTASVDSTGGGAAGSVYMKLILTNSGTQPCVLNGFPGVSLTSGPAGDPIGAAAARDDSQPVTQVLLAPGKAGFAQLRYTQAGNYPECTQAPAAGFRVYPPEDTASLFIPQQYTACSNTNINLLTVQAFQAG
ncbi:DUF4232 domain-containing protein [Arthrobacter bambusae]|uniref:DUF4232 domain-containing protein n=1 Tax=Arthrobacter bambusae TaxID=1338426 RepID=A0AAW8DJL9_9MICC|nr:DUF4232 domain-containing protein [Arthrobacter bambusae]MDP9906795.1 hypothetical protein [Arthrobacter bambusae]MDQ0130908.1 hypothetical protein [Arthrobacter bambusae]MDQ0182430.1 hypothetical protein [Arthrobacter bambusae]